MKVNPITKQYTIPFIGAARQIYSGASTWITIATFSFSGLAAWNTSTMSIIREHLPWLNLGVFVLFIIALMLFAMWIEHKFFQASIMNYWARMFWQDEKSEDFIKRQKHIEEMLEKLTESKHE